MVHKIIVKNSNKKGMWKLLIEWNNKRYLVLAFNF